MIEDLLLIAVSLFPFVIAVIFALIVTRIVEKKQRAQRKAEHQAQADADMAEMQKVYYEVLFTEIMKGN